MRRCSWTDILHGYCDCCINGPCKLKAQQIVLHKSHFQAAPEGSNVCAGGGGKAITITHTIWWLIVQDAYENKNLLLLQHTHGTIIMENNHIICKRRLFPFSYYICCESSSLLLQRVLTVCFFVKRNSTNEELTRGSLIITSASEVVMS